MDQTKTGLFIKELRKGQNLTQKELAAKLCVSEKTVSKWETGNGLPDVGTMLPLCEIFGITVNELLCGEKLAKDEYIGKAEENFAALLEDKVSGKTKNIVAAAALILVILSSLALLVVCAGYADLPVWLRVALVAAGALTIVAFVALLCVFGASGEIFECPHCGKKFSATLSAYIFGMHTLTKRRLRCPHCGKKSWCKSLWRN